MNETQTVSITLSNETREVTVERFSSAHCWFAVDAPVLYRFRSGAKLHLVSRPQVLIPSERCRVRAPQFASATIHNRNTFPVAFADKVEQTNPVLSQWNEYR